MIDTDKYKTRLEEELKLLETELATVAKINPDNKADWEPKETDMNVSTADANELADKREQYKENDAILYDLEIRYNNVKLALKKIEEGTYGICEIGGEEIEEDRLDANPAARTDKKHIDNEADLK